jgi:CBS domain containing-hemolysin-like protein
VMVPRVNVVGIPLGATREEIAGVLRSSTFTRYPVYRNDLDDVVGHVHVKDLLPKLLGDEPLQDEGLRTLPFLPHTADMDAVLSAMGQHRSDVAVVMDEYGGMAGIVTRKDLLDEVVGEMNEEGAAAGIRVDPHGKLLVAGTVRLEELSAHLDLALEHEEVDTIGGLVLSILERPPAVGDAVPYLNLVIEVTAVVGRQVKGCRVVVTGTEESGAADSAELP